MEERERDRQTGSPPPKKVCWKTDPQMKVDLDEVVVWKKRETVADTCEEEAACELVPQPLL